MSDINIVCYFTDKTFSPGISKVPLEIPQKISCPYIHWKMYTLYGGEILKSQISELVNVFETSPFPIGRPWRISSTMTTKNSVMLRKKYVYIDCP